MTRPGLSALLPLLAAALLAPAPVHAGEPPEGSTTAPEKPPGGGDQPPDSGAPSDQPPASGTAPAPPPAPGTAPAQPAPAAAANEPPASGDTWIDASHAFIEQRVFAPILRLDRFFSDERDTEPEREKSFLRWRSEMRLAEDSRRPSFTTGVHATLRLPGLDERLRRIRLVLAGETRDAIDALFPRELAPGQTEPPVDQDTIGAGDAGIRYFLFDTLAYHADLGGGFLLKLPPGVYGRLRFRWAFPVGKLLLSRLALIGYWRSDVKFGTTATAELNRSVSRWLLLRVSGNGNLSQHSSGVEWWSEVAGVVPLPPRSAAQIGVAWNGATEASTAGQDRATGAWREFRVPTLARTRAYARLRTDVYRRWLFVEIEPEVAWPWTPERGRYSAWGISLRAEVQFQGKEAPPKPLPPPPPEPKDPPEPDEPKDPPASR